MGHTLLQHCFLAIVMAALTVSAQAASRPKTTSTPDTVKDVLQSESLITSLSVDRRETLHPGTRPQNDSVSIWWQSGYVRSGKHWLPYEELAVGDPSEAKLDEYRSLRAELLEDPHGSWKLATWCRKNSLFDQERVHLLQVLEIKDSSVSLDAVYERLGCQKVGDEWVSPQSRREAALLQVEMEASYKKWHSKLDLIAEQLEGISLQRGIAEKQLTAIRSPSAVPAIVSILCMRTSNTAPGWMDAR